MKSEKNNIFFCKQQKRWKNFFPFRNSKLQPNGKAIYLKSTFSEFERRWIVSNHFQYFLGLEFFWKRIFLFARWDNFQLNLLSVPCETDVKNSGSQHWKHGGPIYANILAAHNTTFELLLICRRPLYLR